MFMDLRPVRLLHFPNVWKNQVWKKYEFCYSLNLSNGSIHTFSELEFAEHLGNEANGHAFRAKIFELGPNLELRYP